MYKPRFGKIANSKTSTAMGKAFTAAEKSSSKKGKKKSKAPSMKKMQKEEDNEQTGY